MNREGRNALHFRQSATSARQVFREYQRGRLYREVQPEELNAKITYASSSKEVATKMRGREDMEMRQKLCQLDRCEDVWMKMEVWDNRKVSRIWEQIPNNCDYKGSRT